MIERIQIWRDEGADDWQAEGNFDGKLITATGDTPVNACDNLMTGLVMYESALEDDK